MTGPRTTPPGAQKWTLDDVERLGRFMAREGISAVVLPGLRIVRHPQESLAQTMRAGATASAGEAAPSDKPRDYTPSDDELLMNPLAGLEGTLHG